jgi:periplasmic protein TonB
METKPLVLHHGWNEVIFENRNKEYGAYPLRKQYTKRLIFGLVISTGIITALFALAEVLSRHVPHADAKKKDEKIIELIDEPVIIPNTRKQKMQRTSIAINPNAPVRVVTDQTPVEKPAEQQSESLTENPNGSVDGELDVVATHGLSVEGIEGVPQVVETPTVTDFPQVWPEYEGGHEAMMKFITKHMRYPSSAARQGIQGPVFVQFVVKGDGSISDVLVIRGIHPDCDKEAARVVSMLKKWRGGKQNGIPVGVRMVLPITFSLK